MAHDDAIPVLVLTTVPGDYDGEGLARALVDRRLAACVSVLPTMVSTYRWRGLIERADERQLLIKTRRDRVEALRTALADLHPYDVPELLVLPVLGGSTAYLTWMLAETGA